MKIVESPRTQMWMASASLIVLILAATSTTATSLNKPPIDDKSSTLLAASINPGQNGGYIDVGMTTVQDKPVFFTTEGGAWVMYFWDGDASSSDGSDSSDMEDEGEGMAEGLGNGGDLRKRSLRAGELDEIARKQSFGSLGSLSTPRSGGKMSTLSNVAHAVTASKAECMDGWWILLSFPFGDDLDTYPVYFSSDCADHPVDITAPWLVVVDNESLSQVAESLSFACLDDEKEDGEEGEEKDSLQCINLGSPVCESQEECCSANDMNMNVKCWDGRCCNKTGQPCMKDSQCCNGLSCMDDGLCANPDAGKNCVSLGMSGCATTADCCSANDMKANSECSQGRCCNQDGDGCENDADCCVGYMCDMTNFMCMMEE